MRWNSYQIATTTAAEDIVSCMLADLGIAGVLIEDHIPLTEADTAKMFIDILPELPADDGTARVTFYLDADADNTAMLAKVRQGLSELRESMDIGSGDITVTQTADADWENNWKAYFHPFLVSDILIRPTWEEAPDAMQQKAAVTIRIDPGISFGTGSHETTKLCMQALRRYLQPGDRILDLGCGSGILSILSLKLGAGDVTAVDIDETCIRSTAENLAANELSVPKERLISGNLIEDALLRQQLAIDGFDIVVANILADVIIPMAPYIPSFLKEGGCFIGSGIIDFKERETVQALESAGLIAVSTERMGEWVGVVFKKGDYGSRPQLIK